MVTRLVVVSGPNFEASPPLHGPKLTLIYTIRTLSNFKMLINIINLA